MKLEEIKKLCKKNKTIILHKRKYGLNGFEMVEQWLGDDKGYFLLQGCPEFSEGNIYAVFDINDEDKYTFIDRDLKTIGVSLEDEDDTEIGIETSLINITIENKQFVTAFTSEGATLIDLHYFKPFSDFEPKCELFERKTNSGNLYFVMKYGMLVVGVIMPQIYRVNNFYEEFSKLSREVSKTLLKQGVDNYKDRSEGEQQSL